MGGFQPTKDINKMPTGVYNKTLEHRKKISLSKKGKLCGKDNPSYKGGKVLDKNGYIRMRGSVNARQYEHQLVMEQYLGRKLNKGEEVHHINGKKTDNRIENLYLVDKKNHSREHFKLFLEVQKLEWENIWLKEELKKARLKIKKNKYA